VASLMDVQGLNKRRLEREGGFSKNYVTGLMFEPSHNYYYFFM
jgi:hypothetical protein